MCSKCICAIFSICIHISIGSPSSVRNLIATVTCLQLSIRTIWDPATGNPLCGDISYDVMLSLSNGTIIMVTSTTNNFYTFSDSTPATDYYVTVAGRNNAGVGESVRVDITSQSELLDSYYHVYYMWPDLKNQS